MSDQAAAPSTACDTFLTDLRDERTSIEEIVRAHDLPFQIAVSAPEDFSTVYCSYRRPDDGPGVVLAVMLVDSDRAQPRAILVPSAAGRADPTHGPDAWMQMFRDQGFDDAHPTSYGYASTLDATGQRGNLWVELTRGQRAGR